MEPIEAITALREWLPQDKQQRVLAILEEVCGIAGTFAMLASSPRYQKMTVGEAIEELIRNGLPVPEDTMALLTMEDYND